MKNIYLLSALVVMVIPVVFCKIVVKLCETFLR